jgi:hypothetical protein
MPAEGAFWSNSLYVGFNNGHYAAGPIAVLYARVAIT